MAGATIRSGHRNAYLRYLEFVSEPDDLVIWRSDVVAELCTLRIAAVLFTPQCHFLLGCAYQNSTGAGKRETLSDISVRLGYTELPMELLAQGCKCTLNTIRFYHFQDAMAGPEFPKWSCEAFACHLQQSYS